MDSLLLPIVIAILGGVSLGINRAFLGRLGQSIGASGASVVNHVGGAIFLFFIVLLTGRELNPSVLLSAPSYAYIGGLIGALFVALVSWLIPRAGVMKTTILLISGQVLLSTILDFFMGRVKSIPMAILGLSLILGGVFIGEYRKAKKASKI